MSEIERDMVLIRSLSLLALNNIKSSDKSYEKDCLEAWIQYRDYNILGKQNDKLSRFQGICQKCGHATPDACNCVRNKFILDWMMKHAGPAYIELKMFEQRQSELDNLVWKNL